MGKKKAKAPKAPDPNVVIPLQTRENNKAFQYQLDQQRVNSYDPYGSKVWEKNSNFDQAGYDKALADFNANPLSKLPGAAARFGPDRSKFEGTPTWTLRETLSPAQQKIFDANTASQLGQSQLLQEGTKRVSDSLATPYTGKADELGVADYIRGLAADSTSDQFNRDIGDAVYNSQTRYLDPQNAREKQSLEARLADQGFVPGTPGYKQAMETFGDTTNRAYGAARDASILQGYGQGNTSLARRESIAGLLGNANAQLIAQQLALRNQPLNELNALRGGTQVQNPNTQAQYNTPSLQPVDAVGAYNNQYQGQLAQYNADVAQNNGVLGALTGLAGAAMFSPFGAAAGKGLSGLFSGGGTAGALTNGLAAPGSGFFPPVRFGVA
jgi:hypothetical protein